MLIFFSHLKSEYNLVLVYWDFQPVRGSPSARVPIIFLCLLHTWSRFSRRVVVKLKIATSTCIYCIAILNQFKQFNTLIFKISNVLFYIIVSL